MVHQDLCVFLVPHSLLLIHGSVAEREVVVLFLLSCLKQLESALLADSLHLLDVVLFLQSEVLVLLIFLKFSHVGLEEDLLYCLLDWLLLWLCKINFTSLRLFLIIFCLRDL